MRREVPALEYAAALDDAANLGLLRKVGHAYVFYHDLIRAQLQPKTSEQPVSKRS